MNIFTAEREKKPVKLYHAIISFLGLFIVMSV